MPRHDEVRAFASTTAALAKASVRMPSRWDAVALVTTFKAVFLEEIEVIVIVLSVGAAGHVLVPAGLGAVAACVAVALTAWILRRPLADIPENTLKFTVGVLLTSFGAFWIGEGAGFQWPGADLSIFGLAGGFLTLSLVCVAALRPPEIQGRAS
jgi:uncharacterized membrane protein